MTENLRLSREHQIASLKSEQSNLQQELDKVPLYKTEERNRIQAELDRISKNLDSLGGSDSKSAVESGAKPELSIADMTRLVVEYNSLKKSQSELNSAHSDRARIQVELDKIGAELKRNNVDADNRMVMGLIEANLQMAKQIDELQKKLQAVSVDKVVTGAGVEGAGEAGDAATKRKVETNVENPDLVEFNEKLVELDVLAEEVRTQMAGTDAAKLEAAITQLNAAHGEAGDATLLLVGDELTNATSRLEAMKINVLVEEARAKLAELNTATTNPAKKVDAPVGDGTPKDAADAGGSASKPDVDKTPTAENKSRFPKWSGVKKLMRRVWGFFASRDEDSQTPVEKKIENKKGTIETKDQMEKVLKDAEEILEEVDINFEGDVNLEGDLVDPYDFKRTYDFRRFNRVDANLKAWSESIDSEEFKATEEEKKALKSRLEAIKAKIDDQKRQLIEMRVKFN